LLAQEKLRSEGDGAGKAGVYVGLNSPEVLHGSVGLDPNARLGGGPGEQVLLPLGEALGRPDHDVEQLDGLEPAGPGIWRGDDVAVPDARWGQEEPDWQGEAPGEADELIGGDLADAATVDGSFEGGPAGRGETGTEVGGASSGDAGKTARPTTPSRHGVHRSLLEAAA
jgi:hypothetical protein